MARKPKTGGLSKYPNTDLDVTMKFGGGLHTRATEDEIDPREAADGFNFDLDFENRELRNRAPFDLIGTVPNAAEIRGGGSMIAADGTVTMLIQAGDTVYAWDGATAFTSKGTVDASAKLRGHWASHYWSLDDLLILTDLNLVEKVKSWNGSALSTISFVKTDASAFGNFYAKYCSVTTERVVFAGCRDLTTNKHMIVGSKVETYDTISVSNKPSSGLGVDDPFYMLTPDLRAINGFVQSFGTSIVSTEKGRIFQITGSSAQDFAVSDFYAGSYASGEESMIYIGNDVIYGRPGRIESVRDTNRFGDAEADDLTAKVADSVENYNTWRSVFNSRLNRVYVFPDDASEVWVFDTAVRDAGGVSPWMRWVTDHPLAFQPTFVMSMIDPGDGLEYVFMGDSSGNLYRLEGSGDRGDGGAYDISMEFQSKMLSAPVDAQLSNIEGWVKYRKGDASEVDIIMEFAGTGIFSHSLTISIPEVEGRRYWGDVVYYGDGTVYGTKQGKLARQPFFSAGQSNDFQIRVRCTGLTTLQLSEIGLRFNAAS